MTTRTETAPFSARLWRYLAERFPLAAYTPLMAVAAFAAIAVSRAGRGVPGFHWTAWGIGVATLLVLFFFLRVLDEHKDAADDVRHRPELPVPRGLVTLRELRATALVALAAALALNARLDPALLVVLAGVLAWAGFMGREFFVRDWLRARPAWYLVSHMVIMPLLFFYATALDWLVAGAPPPPGTTPFLALAFCNGLVIEVGRKVRTPEDERDGVDTYSGAWGLRPATAVWAAAVAGAALTAVLLRGDIGAPGWLAPALPAAAVLVVIPPLTGEAGVRRVEALSGVWVLLSYGLVGTGAWFAAAGVG